MSFDKINEHQDAPHSYLYRYDTSHYLHRNYEIKDLLRRITAILSAQDSERYREIPLLVQKLEKKGGAYPFEELEPFLDSLTKLLSNQTPSEISCEALKIILKLIKMGVFKENPPILENCLATVLSTTINTPIDLRDNSLLMTVMRFRRDYPQNDLTKKIEEGIINAFHEKYRSPILSNLFEYLLSHPGSLEAFLSLLAILNDQEVQCLAGILQEYDTYAINKNKCMQQVIKDLYLIFVAHQNKSTLSALLIFYRNGYQIRTLKELLNLHNFYISDFFMTFIAKRKNFILNMNRHSQEQLVQYLLILETAQVKAKIHSYGTQGVNAHKPMHVLIVWYLEQTGVLEKLLWEKNLPQEEFEDRLKNLVHLILIIKRKKIHTEVNTLKALAYFIPRGNPDFRLHDPSTLALVIRMLKSSDSLKKLKKALLYLDLFHPKEAEDLFNFHQKFPDIYKITKEMFQLLTDAQQVECIKFLSAMRMRNIEIPCWVLKNRTGSEQLCLSSLKWLAAARKNVSKHKQQIMEELIKTHHSYAIRSAAVRALWSTSLDANNVERRNVHIQELLKTANVWLSDEISLYQLELIKIIAEYSFNEEQDQKILSDLLQLSHVDSFSKKEKILQEFVFTFMRIVAYGVKKKRPALFSDFIFDRLLMRAHEIVTSDIWKDWDKEYAFDNSSTHFETPLEVRHLKYPIFQHFEFNRHRMSVGILDLFSYLYSEILDPLVENFPNKEACLTHYKINFLEPLKEDNLGGASPYVYYIPFLHLNKSTHIFRGIGTKQGEKMSQIAVLEAITSGNYPRSVENATHDTGNWSKRKEELSGTFTTASYSEATSPLYFNQEDGALFVIHSDKINQDRMGMKLRIETELAFNFVSQGGLSRFNFQKIYLDPSWKADLDLIAGRSQQSKDFAVLVKEYDQCQSVSLKKTVKKRLHKELNLIRFCLTIQTKKEIFKFFTSNDILSLHRHLNNPENFYERIVFREYHEFLQETEPSEDTISKHTLHRLVQMEVFQKEYYEKFGVPFVLGQDRILIYDNKNFLNALDPLMAMLSPFDQRVTLIDGHDSLMARKECLIRFTQSLEKLQEINPYFLKIFRLALFFKDVEMKSLTKFLMSTDYHTFFGFDHAYRLPVRCLLDFVWLYQKCKSEKKVCVESLSKVAQVLIHMDLKLDPDLLKKLINIYLNNSNF